MGNVHYRKPGICVPDNSIKKYQCAVRDLMRANTLSTPTKEDAETCKEVSRLKVEYTIKTNKINIKIKFSKNCTATSNQLH